MSTKRKKRKKKTHPMKGIVLKFYKNRLSNFLRDDYDPDFKYTEKEAKQAARQSTLDALRHDVPYNELLKIVPKS